MIGMWQFWKIAYKRPFFNWKWTFLLVLIGLTACGENEDKGAVIAKVDDEKLYTSDLYFLNYSSEDSAEVVSAYVDQWVNEKILVNAALSAEEIDQHSIDRKVADYRNDLLIHEIENLRIEQELDTVVDMEEIETYYQNHKNDFQLNDYLVKVLYLKIPLDAPDVEKIGGLYKLKTEGDLKEVEIYAKMYASNFYYDIESWIYFDDLLKEIPLHDINKDSFILKRSKIRFEENGFYYFLNIVDYKLKNSISPLSFERENIKARILNQRIKTLRESIKNDIIKKAYEDGNVKLY